MPSIARLSLGARDWSGDRDVARPSPERSWCLMNVQTIIIMWAVGRTLGWRKPGVGEQRGREPVLMGAGGDR